LGILSTVELSLCLPERASSGIREELGEIGHRQLGIVRRNQLIAAGMTARAIDGMLVAGRWRTHGSVLVAMHNGPLTPDQQLWAAVLNAGPFAALAARTAAAQHGLAGWTADCIEVLVPRGAAVPPGLGLSVKVHESRRFGPSDLHVGRALPQVRVERALVDAAVWSARPRTACGVLAAGVQQRLTTSAKLLTELELAGAVRHRRLLAAALADIGGGAQAVSEIDFVRFCRRNGLPRPELQAVRRDGSGRRRYLDATLRGRDGSPVRVEIDGALHLVVQTYWDDMARGNDLILGREQLLRFPSYVIYADDPVAVNQLRRALGLSGLEHVWAS
jgi:hypothetical protein